MELIKHTIGAVEKAAIEQLPTNYQHYVRLRQEKPLTEYDEYPAKQICAMIIREAFRDITSVGSKIEYTPAIIEEQRDLLYREVSKNFRSITPSELKECFSVGVRGESGPYFGLCPKTYNQFLKFWVENTLRGKAWTEYLAKINGWKLAEKPIIPKSFYYNACEEAFKDYRERKKLPFTPSSIYDFTAEYLGLETLINKPDWPEIKKQAKEDYLKEIKKLPKDFTKDWTMDPNENKVLARSIKLVALTFFYDSLISQRKEALK